MEHHIITFREWRSLRAGEREEILLDVTDGIRDRRCMREIAPPLRVVDPSRVPHWIDIQIAFAGDEIVSHGAVILYDRDVFVMRTRTRAIIDSLVGVIVHAHDVCPVRERAVVAYTPKDGVTRDRDRHTRAWIHTLRHVVLSRHDVFPVRERALITDTYASFRQRFEDRARERHIVRPPTAPHRVDDREWIDSLRHIVIPQWTLRMRDIDRVFNTTSYEDVSSLFARYPSLRLRVRMYSGKEAVITKWTLSTLLAEHAGDYDDTHDPHGNFAVLSILRHDPNLDERIREHETRVFGHPQPALFGIDDLRFHIDEKHVEGDYYCPTNGNCMYKCIVKWLEINHRNVDDHPELDLIDEHRSWTIPETNTALRKATSTIRVIAHTTKNGAYDRYLTVPIYKYELQPGYYHAILVIDRKRYRDVIRPNIRVDWRYVNVEDVDQEVLDEWSSYERVYTPSSKRMDPCTRLFAFDFETRKGDATEINDPMLPSGFLYRQTPYMMQWGDARTVDHQFDIDQPEQTVSDKFLSFLNTQLHMIHMQKLARKDHKSKREVIMFSFNGAVFDNHLLLDYLNHPHWHVKSDGYLGDDSVIKKFSIGNHTLKFWNEVSFMDLRLFFTPNVSLKKACAMYDCDQQKDDLDIVQYMDVDSILIHRDKIIQYGLQDVRALHELAMKHRRYLKEVSGTDIDIFACVSIADFASAVRDVYTRSTRHTIYVNSRDEIAEFERACVRGGRVHVGRTRCDDPLVAADANGLYASAMFLKEYPCGPRKLFNRRCHPRKMRQIRADLNRLQLTKSYLLKVRYKINPRCVIPLLPLIDDSDPCGEEKEGCFTSVDLLEAVRHGGYAVKEVMFAMEFESSSPLFTSFVDMFYQKRSEYKTRINVLRAREETEQQECKRLDVLQDLCKLIVNSSYGSFLLKKFPYTYSFLRDKTFWKDLDPTVELVSRCNDQYLVRRRNCCAHDNRRPLYLGAFILSFSKTIMNRFISEIDGFFSPGRIVYGDTDSLYVHQSDYDVLRTHGCIGDAMGQCKNDYGNRIIHTFICLGKKMKVCMLNDGTIMTTIKGFQGLRQLTPDARRDLFDRMSSVSADIRSESFASVTYETMRRSGFAIDTLSTHRNFRPTVHDQYIVTDHICYPLYWTGSLMF